MSKRRQNVLFREMILDLHYRLLLADDSFCRTAEALMAAAATEEWQSRCDALRLIGEYSQTLQLINSDLCRVADGKQAVFPADLGAWIFDSGDGEFLAQRQLKRLRAIAEGLEMTVDRELLCMDSGGANE